jgi:hypothetical protein
MGHWIMDSLSIFILFLSESFYFIRRNSFSSVFFMNPWMCLYLILGGNYNSHFLSKEVEVGTRVATKSKNWRREIHIEELEGIG